MTARPPSPSSGWATRVSVTAATWAARSAGPTGGREEEGQPGLGDRAAAAAGGRRRRGRRASRVAGTPARGGGRPPSAAPSGGVGETHVVAPGEPGAAVPLRAATSLSARSRRSSATMAADRPGPRLADGAGEVAQAVALGAGIGGVRGRRRGSRAPGRRRRRWRHGRNSSAGHWLRPVGGPSAPS